MSEAFSRTKADDIQEAKELLQELFFQGNLCARVRDAQRALRKWSTNRVEEIFSGKARRVDAYELLTLRALKEAKLIREGKRLRDARRAHAEFNEETERLAEMFAYGDEDFARPEIEARRSVAGRVDLPRVDGGDQ